MFCDLIKGKLSDSGTMHHRDRKAHRCIQIPEGRMQSRQSLAVAFGAQLQENGYKWKVRNRLGFFALRLMKHCNRLSEEAVVSRCRLHMVLCQCRIHQNENIVLLFPLREMPHVSYLFAYQMHCSEILNNLNFLEILNNLIWNYSKASEY